MDDVDATPAGDERGDAFEDPAAIDGPRCQVGRPRQGAAEAGTPIAASERRQPVGESRVVAGGGGDDRAQVLGPDEGRGQAAGSESLDDRADSREVRLEPTGCSGRGQAVEPGLGQRVEEINGDCVAAVGLERPQEQQVVGEALGNGDDVGHAVCAPFVSSSAMIGLMRPQTPGSLSRT